MFRTFTLTIVLLSFFINQNAICQNIWINELNYDTPGQDTSEFVEIAGIAGTLLDTYSIRFVNGMDGETYLTLPLSGTIPNEKNGLGSLSFSFTNKIQNGQPDGLALVKDGKEVIQFLSYEGPISNWMLDNKSYTSQELTESDGNNAPDVSLQAGSNVLSPTSWTLDTPTPSRLNAGQGNIVLSLKNSLIDPTISLHSKETEIFSLQGQKIEYSGMISGQVYLIRTRQGNTVRTQKILFDL